MASSLAVYGYGNTAEPSAIRSYYNKLVGGLTQSSYKFDEREGVVHTAVESGATGVALGAAHAMLPGGLDAKVGPVKAPLDAVVGIIGLLASSTMHGKVGRSVHAIADRAVAVYAFRSTAKLLSAKSAVHGEFGEDPLTEAAKDL